MDELLDYADFDTSGLVNMSSDQAFGPQLGSAFDFTLTFDHSILSILPNGLFILAAPFFIYYFKNQTEVILPGPLLWSKLVSAIPARTCIYR